MKLEKKVENIGEEKEFNAEGYYNNYTDINELIEFINIIKEGGATHLQWDASYDCDGVVENVSVQGLLIYEETKEEAKKRIRLYEERVKEREAKNLAFEKKEYKRLKKKLGK